MTISEENTKVKELYFLIQFFSSSSKLQKSKCYKTMFIIMIIDVAGFKCKYCLTPDTQINKYSYRG